MITKEQLLETIRNDKACQNGLEPIFSILLMTKSGNDELIFQREGKEVPSGWPDFGDFEEVGFFYDIDSAVRAVHENWADIQDQAFHAAFILCRFPGLYNRTHKGMRMYFRWDPDAGCFVQQEEPPFWGHILL